jgi:hypothetical protein
VAAGRWSLVISRVYSLRVKWPALDLSRIEAGVIHPRDVRVDQPDRQPAGEDLVRERVNEFGGQRGRDVITNSRQGPKVDLAEALPADIGQRSGQGRRPERNGRAAKPRVDR